LRDSYWGKPLHMGIVEICYLRGDISETVKSLELHDVYVE
jgi:hypothetical protein